MGKKKRLDIKRIGEVMDEMDTPHGEFDLGESFQKKGAGAPAGPRPSQALLNAFRQGYEPVESEHFAQVLFTMGALREYFQAWIVPKMPDPLPAYLDELDYMGYHVRTGFDGTSCIMVRHRGCVDVHAEEVSSDEPVPEEVKDDDIPVYTDNWNDDMSDIRNPFEEK